MRGFIEPMTAAIAKPAHGGRAASMRRWLPWKACRGTTAIELALILPGFLLLFLGIVEFGRLFWMQSTLQQAVESAARCAVVPGGCGNANPTDYAASQMFGLTVPSSIFQVKTGANCAIYDPHYDTTTPQIKGDLVSGSLSFHFLVPSLFPWTITLNAQSCRPT